MLELAFHLLLLPVDGWALFRLRRRRDARTLLSGLLAVAAAGLALAFLGMVTREDSRLFGSRFTLIGLLALGIFAHGPVLLIAAGVLLRREVRRWSWAAFVTAAALLVVAVDAWFIEPTWLEVTHHRVVSAKLDRALRIVVLADIQTDEVGEYERRAIRIALDQEPDLIVLPGDYLQIGSPQRYQAAIALLNSLLLEEGFAAPRGILAVEGNVDRPGWESIFEGIDVFAFNETLTVQHAGLWLTGLSFADSFDTSLQVQQRDGFHIVVGHAPDYALGQVDADLLIAGHTHGGQIRIPGFGPPLTLSAVPRDWAAGKTTLPGHRTLFVSRGVGLERGHAPRIRFFCRPEIAVIDVVPLAEAPAGADR